MGPFPYLIKLGDYYVLRIRLHGPDQPIVEGISDDCAERFRFNNMPFWALVYLI